MRVARLDKSRGVMRVWQSYYDKNREKTVR